MMLKKMTPYLVTLQLVLVLVLLVQVNGLNSQLEDVSGNTVIAPAPNRAAPTAPAVVADPGTIVTDGDTILHGNPDTAKVLLVEYSDFQCPFCERASPTVKALIDKYGDDIAVVYKDFPLNFHANAQISAEAAECADDQNFFAEYHDILFAKGAADGSGLARDDLIGYAGDLGLDVDTFTTCLDSGEKTAEVLADMAEGQANGVRGTPGFLLNGVLISGAQPQAVFEAEISKYI